MGFCMETKEEEHRNVRIEIDATQKRIPKVESGVHKEETIATQLRKDNKHIRVEMDSNLRATKELKGDAEFNETLLQTLEGSLRSDVMQPLEETHVVSTIDSNGDVNDSDKENSSSDNGSSTSMTSKKFLQIKKARMTTDFLPMIDKGTMAQIKKKTSEINDEVAMLRHTIVAENLEDTVQQKRTETEARRQELESETLRKQQIRTAIRELRAKGEQNALGLAAKRQILEDNKTKATAELKLKQTELEEAEAELCSLKTQEEWDKELVTAEKERDSIAQVIADAEAMIAKGETSKKEREGVEDAIQDLKATEQELLAKIESRKECLQAVQVELTKAKEDADVVQSEKVENDQYEAEKVWPAESQIKDINEDKKRFTKSIEELSAEMKTDGDKAKGAEQEQKAKLAGLQEEARLNQEQLVALATELRDLTEKKQDEAAEFEKDVKGLRSQIASADIMTNDQQTRLAEVKKGKEDAMKYALEEAEDACKEVERHRGILAGGVQLLEIVANCQKEEEEDIEAKKRVIWGGTPIPTSPKQTQSADDVLSQFDMVLTGLSI